MNKGYFKEGPIELKNTNYKIAGTLEASEIMQKIEENIIYLKQINYGTEAIADIPIGLKVEEEFIIENLNKENILILKGTYITGAREEKAIEKIKINAIWISKEEVKVTNEIYY